MAKSQFIILFVAVVFLAEVQCKCTKDDIKKIKKVWDCDPPSDVLTKLVGTYTYLYAAPFMVNYTEGLKCSQMVLDRDELSATDYYNYTDSKDNMFGSYYVVEEQKGALALINAGFSEDFLYVVYFKNGVLGFVQCGDEYDPFSNIAVLNYEKRKDDSDTKTAIAEAKSTLLKLGYKFNVEVKTICSSGKD